MSGWSTMRVADGAAAAGDDVEVPGGSPHSSSSSSASAIADSGVCDAGFSTTGQPAAIAGATLWATRLSGKLNGLIAPTTPIGHAQRERRACPRRRRDASIGTISPASVRASTAANVNVDTARCASTRAVLIGLAASSAMMRANSSVRSREQVRGAVEDLGALPRRRAGSRDARCRGQRHRARRPPRRRTRARGRSRDRRRASAPRSRRRCSMHRRVRRRSGGCAWQTAFRGRGDGSARRRMGGELELAVEDLLEQRALAPGAPDLELGVVEGAHAEQHERRRDHRRRAPYTFWLRLRSRPSATRRIAASVRTRSIAAASSSGNSSDTRGSPRRCHRTIAASSSTSSGAKPRSCPLRTRYAPCLW